MKTCHFCGAEAGDTSTICVHCRQDLGSDWSPTPTVSRRAGLAPAVLSLLLPGAGQMYQGDLFGGLLWLVAVAIGYAAFLVPGVVLHLLCVLFAGCGRMSPADTRSRAVSTHSARSFN